MCCRVTAFVGLAVLIAACSGVPLPRAECPVLSSTPGPGDLGCSEAVAVASAALPSGHVSVVRIHFQWGGYCAPGSYCPLIGPSAGIVIFTFQPRFGSRTTDGYVQVVREDDGQVRVASPLTAIDAQGIPRSTR